MEFYCKCFSISQHFSLNYRLILVWHLLTKQLVQFNYTFKHITFYLNNMVYWIQILRKQDVVDVLKYTTIYSSHSFIMFKQTMSNEIILKSSNINFIYISHRCNSINCPHLPYTFSTIYPLNISTRSSYAKLYPHALHYSKCNGALR